MISTVSKQPTTVEIMNRRHTALFRILLVSTLHCSLTRLVSTSLQHIPGGGRTHPIEQSRTANFYRTREAAPTLFTAAPEESCNVRCSAVCRFSDLVRTSVLCMQRSLFSLGAAAEVVPDTRKNRGVRTAAVWLHVRTMSGEPVLEVCSSEAVPASVCDPYPLENKGEDPRAAPTVRDQWIEKLRSQAEQQLLTDRTFGFGAENGRLLKLVEITGGAARKSARHCDSISWWERESPALPVTLDVFFQAVVRRPFSATIFDHIRSLYYAKTTSAGTTGVFDGEADRLRVLGENSIFRLRILSNAFLDSIVMTVSHEEDAAGARVEEDAAAGAPGGGGVGDAAPTWRTLKRELLFAELCASWSAPFLRQRSI